MDQISYVFTPKDRLYVSDVLTMTMTLAKKARYYSTICQDQALKEEFATVEDVLSGHWNDFLCAMEGE